MTKYYDTSGAELTAPDLSTGTLIPQKTVHHDAVAAVVHEESKTLPGGTVLRWTVTDSPAQPAWDEVTEYTYTPLPPTEADKLAAQVTYTAMMTDTLLPVTTNESEASGNV